MSCDHTGLNAVRHGGNRSLNTSVACLYFSVYDLHRLTYSPYMLLTWK